MKYGIQFVILILLMLFVFSSCGAITPLPSSTDAQEGISSSKAFVETEVKSAELDPCAINVAEFRVERVDGGAGSQEIISGEIGSLQYDEISSTYPVFIDKYPFSQEGPLFEIDTVYREKSYANIQQFMSILEGEVFSVSANEVEELPQRTKYVGDSFSISADPELLTLILHNLDISKTEDVLTNEYVIAMLEYCNIKNPKINVDIFETEAGIYYEYKITDKYDSTFLSSINDNLTYVTVQGRGTNGSEYVFVEGMKTDCSEIYAEQSILNPSNVIADLNSIYDECIENQVFEITYLDDIYTGYHVPCYKVYVKETGCDKYNVHYYRMCIVD